MTAVYRTNLDLSELLPALVYSIVLGFFGLGAVFVTLGIFCAFCAHGRPGDICRAPCEVEREQPRRFSGAQIVSRLSRRRGLGRSSSASTSRCELGRAENALGDLGEALLDPAVAAAARRHRRWLSRSAGCIGRRIEKALEPRVRAIQGRRRLLRFLALLLRRTRSDRAPSLLLGVAALVDAGRSRCRAAATC